MMAIPGFPGTMPATGTAPAERQPDQDNLAAADFAALLASSSVISSVPRPLQEIKVAENQGPMPVKLDSDPDTTGASRAGERHPTPDGIEIAAEGPELSFETPPISSQIPVRNEESAPAINSTASRNLNRIIAVFAGTNRIPPPSPTGIPSTGVAVEKLRAPHEQTRREIVGQANHARAMTDYPDEMPRQDVDAESLAVAQPGKSVEAPRIDPFGKSTFEGAATRMQAGTGIDNRDAGDREVSRPSQHFNSSRDAFETSAGPIAGVKPEAGVTRSTTPVDLEKEMAVTSQMARLENSVKQTSARVVLESTLKAEGATQAQSTQVLVKDTSTGDFPVTGPDRPLMPPSAKVVQESGAPEDGFTATKLRQAVSDGKPSVGSHTASPDKSVRRTLGRVLLEPVAKAAPARQEQLSIVDSDGKPAVGLQEVTPEKPVTQIHGRIVQQSVERAGGVAQALMNQVDRHLDLRSVDSTSVSARVMATIRDATSAVILRGRPDRMVASATGEPSATGLTTPAINGDSPIATHPTRDVQPAITSAESTFDKVMPNGVVAGEKSVLAETGRPKVTPEPTEIETAGDVVTRDRQIRTATLTPRTKVATTYGPKPAPEVRISSAGPIEKQSANDDLIAAAQPASIDLPEDAAAAPDRNQVKVADSVAHRDDDQPLTTRQKIGGIVPTGVPVRVRSEIAAKTSPSEIPDFVAFRREPPQAARLEPVTSEPITDIPDRKPLKEGVEPGPLPLIQEGLQSRVSEKTQTSVEAQQVARQVATPSIEVAEGLRRNETRSIRISLRPDQLGRVEVEVRRDVDGRVSAVLTADRAESAQLLTDGISGLRHHLERAGVIVDRLDVNPAPQFQNPGNQSNNPNNPQNPQREGARNPEYRSANQPNADGQAATEEDRLLNILA